ncbi:MAG: glucose-6-phosphate isomerase [Gammaproteobacteria bacterium BRH_c0]|nr:MAG: glucose-6-phosphate isomerase [Gammaproteobacteria bacterium BRH_c0]
MPGSATSPTATSAWAELQDMAHATARAAVVEHFHADSQRAERYSLRCDELLLDYSKNRIDDAVLSALLRLAREMALPDKIRALFVGAAVNTTEKRPALHMALRGSATLPAEQQHLLNSAIDSQHEKTRIVSEQIRTGQWRGLTGKAITDVINIGIGGSDLGPKMVCTALREFAHPVIRCHFVANVDGAEIQRMLRRLDPETTLVIIASKSFTTHETRLNAETTLDWFREKLGIDAPQSSSHFIAVTENSREALAFGIDPQRIFQLWDWIGGRYSLWSSIGLSIAIAIGYDNFRQLLAGAKRMDEHFLYAPLEQNMPVILALLGIWYRNFLKAETHAVIPYCERLGHFITYLQQLDMESSGKSVSAAGDAIDYPTGTIVWGQTGTNGQHTFLQLIHQGSHLIPVDFIGFIEDSLSTPRHHQALMTHLLAQSAALMVGTTGALPSYRHQPGNRPSNTLLIQKLTPFNLGMLIALYEHKVYSQGVIWNINSFDQWGVELGKVIAGQLLADRADNSAALDPSTRRLLGLISGSDS